MRDSPRLTLVKARARELIEKAADFEGHGVCLVGSVARGEDSGDKDIDFYLLEFESGEPGSIERSKAGDKADALLKEFREILSPYRVDIFPMPGWPLGEAQEMTMLRDAIDLFDLVHDA